MGTFGIRRLGRLLGSLAAALPIATGLAPPAAAAEPFELPGMAIMAVVVDLDGDGAREVVRLVRSPSDEVEVDGWHHGARGWEAIRGAELLSAPDQNAAALLRTTHGGTERVLALTAESIPDDPFGALCCISLREVRQEGGAITLAPVAADDLDGSAHYIQSLDLDADGIDELVTTRMTLDADGAPEASFLEVQAWRDGRYVQVGALAGIEGTSSTLYGETDGVSGAELLIGPTEQGTIHRVALVDDALRVEEGRIDDRDPDRGYFGYATAIAGELIVIMEQRGLRTLSWPSGGEPREVGSLDGLGEYPWVAAVGTGPDAVLVTLPDGGVRAEEARAATAYDLDLREIGEVGMSPTSLALSRFLASGTATGPFDEYPFPYVGLLPPELVGDRPAFDAGGVVVALGADGGIETRPMSPLAGFSLHGMAGPDAEWLAASSGVWSAPPDAVYLSAGNVSSGPGGRSVLIPAEDVWEPSVAGVASVELVSAAFAADGEHLLTSPDGFAAVLDAPPGTMVFANGIRPESHEMGAEPLTVEFKHRRGDEERNSDFEYGLLAVLPDGRVLVEEWEGTVVRQPPALDATSATSTFELGARIAGSASAYADVVVDGHPVEVDADGAFAVSVDAPPWPVDVVVVARDPLGNETSASVQVIGFVDYRGLPWLPIVGLLTALVGVYALLRVPLRRAGPTAAWTDDGTLEEIELE